MPRLEYEEIRRDPEWRTCFSDVTFRLYDGSPEQAVRQFLEEVKAFRSKDHGWHSSDRAYEIWREWTNDDPNDAFQT